MNKNHLFESIGNLDESLLERSETIVMEKGENKAKKIRHFPKVWRTGLVAAVLVCVSAASVYAVGSFLSMSNGKIEIFDKKSNQVQTAGSAETLRGNYVQAVKDMEGFMSDVDKSVTDNGITVTLDQISMDAASLDLFFTLSGEEKIDSIRQQMKEGTPDWVLIDGGCNFLDSRINGKSIVNADQSDSYIAEDGTIKVWEHYLLSEMPQGEVITLELGTQTILGNSGSWNLQIDLDGKSIRSGAKTAQPGVYKMQPYSMEQNGFSGEFVDMDLHLEYLAFGPKGGVIHTAHEPLSFKNENGEIRVETGLNPRMTYMADNTGRTLYAFQNENSVISDTLNLTAADPSASELTITPVRYTGENEKAIHQKRTVTTEQLKEGARIETSSLGGFTVQNYMIHDGVISYEMVPFGWDSGERLVPVDGNVPTLDGRIGLKSSYVDPRTGVITVRIDYYAAKDVDLETINEWTYDWVEAKLDEAQAVTIPLVDVAD